MVWSLLGSGLIYNDGNMKRSILSEEEIEKILDSAFTGIADELFIYKDGRIDSVLNHTKVNNGYIVTMTIGNSGDVREMHVSISNPDGFTDPAESDTIASDVLGDEYETIPGVIFPNMFHYLKAEYVGNKKEQTKGE